MVGHGVGVLFHHPLVLAVCFTTYTPGPYRSASDGYLVMLTEPLGNIPERRKDLK